MTPSDASLPEVTERGRSIYGPTPPGGAVPCERDSALTPAELDAVVEAIAEGREQRRRVVLPASLQTRHWASVTAVALRLDARLGWEPAGWKIGAASEVVRRAEGLPGPSPGRIYRSTVLASPASLPASLFINYRNVECELAFHLARALPARPEPYREAEVADAVGYLTPTLEIGDTVFDDWYGSSAYFGTCLDNGGGAALVHGEAFPEWRALDLPNTRMELRLNGAYVNEGFGRAAMGHPLTSLTWLVNWLSERGRSLEAGEVVSTGTCTGHCFVARGDEVRVTFDGLGVLEARFEG